MNCGLWNTRSLLTQIALRCNCKAPATRRVMQDLGLIRGSAHIKPAASSRPLSTSTSTSPRPRSCFVLGNKVAAATAVTLSATVMAAVCSSHYDREIVPCTNRSHLLVHSHQEERDLGESVFAAEKINYEIVDPRDPASVRVRLIAERIIRAAHRGLGIDDTNDAPMLRVTEKRPKWGRKACAPQQPHTSHLRGLNWEVLLVRDGDPTVEITPAGKIVVFTGFLDYFKTDDEIAAILAHEVGHIIARHQADIAKWAEWLPMSVRLFFARRFEIEADYIGILLLGAAGFDPRWALVIIDKLAKIEGDHVLGNVGYDHPHPKKRLRLLSQPKIMEEAMELYR